MGLDMYLKGRIYVGANYEHNNVNGVIYLTKNGEELDIPFNKITDISIDLGYWRKANAIHGYIVDNFAGGEDDCRDIYLNSDNLKELLKRCKLVQENPDLAPDLLPTKQGFFFGNYEYNDYYFQDIKDTIEIIENALKHKNVSYIYQSSW